MAKRKRGNRHQQDSKHRQVKRVEDDIHRLTAEFIANPPYGSHADGGGLYLRNMRMHGCSWAFT